MTSNSYTFIFVPDAKSQCKRYTIPTSIFYIVGTIGIVLIVIAGIVVNTMLKDYHAISKKVEQVETLQKASISHTHTIDRYEDEITQLSNNLSHIEHLNSRLMVLAGLDPERGEQNLGLGGADEENPKSEAQEK